MDKAHECANATPVGQVARKLGVSGQTLGRSRQNASPFLDRTSGMGR